MAFHDAPSDFVTIPTAHVTIGFLIGVELFAIEPARQYRAEGVELLVAPRASLTPSLEEWIAAGRQAVSLSGAYCLSSGRSDDSHPEAGRGWVLAPDGELLTITTDATPIVSAIVELRRLDLSFQPASESEKIAAERGSARD
jgi:N-carbamoylputrescine amidase